MTHVRYTQQALSRYNLPCLKRIATELDVTPIGDRRAADTWVNAIITHQSNQLQKVDEQALAQGELDHHIADQAQVVASEPLTIVEISFDHHEYYADDKLVASISHDDDHLTQRWVVMVNGKEVFRANTVMRCHRFICTHYKDGSLPVQEQLATPCTTSNEIMAQIFNECEKYGFEILDDGIYQNDVKLGEVGQTDGGWWFTRAADETQRVPCDSAIEAVQSLSMVDVSTDGKSIFDEYILDQPLEQLTGDKLQRLLERTELVTA
ncbi:hypothetical protein H6G97_43470 [Nostoc flagelliforme FACHB-838]|uniref:Uncharacterized protein n=1 Tax=Nostoc flagelliforme FACHB-838 TaxID=2692904 RepID=A0ABR8E5Q0_9NOSO|nr:hypothetical protein [Nostoc flagelliforme]MBD2535845.1 hypothetical protein [Nostoc flagelliforme FACHB-838]